MPVETRNNAHREVDPTTLKEIEMISLAKTHSKLIGELKKNPPQLSNFPDVLYAEFNARALADVYLLDIQKNKIHPNPQLFNVAKGIANDSSYVFLKNFEKDLVKNLKNKHLVTSLLNIVEECVDSAFILATNRSKSRENANSEQLINTTSRIEQQNNLMQQDLKKLVENMTLNNDRSQEAAVPLPAAVAANHINPAGGAAIDVVPQRVGSAHLTTNNNNAIDGPHWLVSQTQCNICFISSQITENCVRAYLVKLFSNVEFLLPLSELPVEKKMEFYRVVNHYYNNAVDAIDWQEKYEKVLRNKRFSKRQAVFKAIGDSVGYGTTDTGISFFYKLPASPSMLCYSNKACSVGSALTTKQCGQYKIPQKCGNFQFVLLIEKTSRRSTFQKIMPDGSSFSLRQ